MTKVIPFPANASPVSDLIEQTSLSLLLGTYGGRRLEGTNHWLERAAPEQSAWPIVDWAWGWGSVVVARLGLVLPSIGQTCTFGGRSAERGEPVADMRDLQNRRRLFLIDKKYSQGEGLSAAEAKELNSLQADFEATLDAVRPLPTQMLAELEQLAEELETEESSP